MPSQLGPLALAKDTIAQTARQTIPTELGPLALTNNTIAQDGRSGGHATQLGPGALARRTNTIALDGHGTKIPTPAAHDVSLPKNVEDERDTLTSQKLHVLPR